MSDYYITYAKTLHYTAYEFKWAELIIFGSEFGLADLSILKNHQNACMPFWRHTGTYAFHINHKHLETRTTFFAHNDFAMIGRGSCNYIHFKLKKKKKKIFYLILSCCYQLFLFLLSDAYFDNCQVNISCDRKTRVLSNKLPVLKDCTLNRNFIYAIVNSLI